MNQDFPLNTIPDHRSKPRMTCHFLAIVSGNDPKGKRFEELGELANLSASGTYLTLKRSIELGEKLFITIHLSSLLEREDFLHQEEEFSKLAATGIVKRIEPQLDGEYGIAIQFESYRLL